VLPLTFANEEDYDKITEHCTISTKGLVGITPDSKIYIFVKPKDGEAFELELKHTMSADQIRWFKSGSALNMIAKENQSSRSVAPRISTKNDL
jgi:aconitase A